MSVIRVPILYVQHQEGHVTGYMLQAEEPTTAFGENKKKVKVQLQDTARYMVEQHDILDELEEPLLSIENVMVQPAYPHGRMTFPSAETMRLQVAVVKATHYDTPMALVPVLNLSFYYNKPSDYRTTLVREVQSALRAVDPGTVSRLFPPGPVELDKILVNLRYEVKDPTFRPPKILGQLAVNLHGREVKRRHSQAWGRDPVVDHLVNRLETDERSLILVGPAGSGKSTILVHAARRLHQDAEKRLGKKEVKPRFWMTRPARILAGMAYLGEWEERTEQLIEDIQSLNGVLCIDDLTALIRLGAGDPSESIAAFLLPYVKQGALRLVIEATPEQLQYCRRLLPEFVNAMDLVPFPEYPPETRAEIYLQAVRTEADRHKLSTGTALDTLITDLFARFKPYHAFPAEPVRFIGELFESSARQGIQSIGSDEAVAYFIKKTGLPSHLIDAQQPLAWERVRDTLQTSIVAQDAACEHMADVITTFKAGLNDPGRPLGVFLFLGPTGVGKTECAKATADYLFGHGEDKQKRLIRLDMSEYAYPGSSLRLLTKSDGLTADWLTQVRNTPFCVVLFDEIEKAAPDVFDLLLNLLDEGRLSDRYGRTTRFNSSVVVMTSNLGTERTAPLGYGDGNAPSSLQTAMKFFRPEFVNRIDHLVPFKALDLPAVERIAALHLARIPKRDGLLERRLTLDWEPGVITLLAKRGYDPRYGARPLKRVIEQQVVTEIARLLVEQPALTHCRLTLKVLADNITVSAAKKA